jgi:glycine/D-amino acid oxidase-like deaminating enzyme
MRSVAEAFVVVPRSDGGHLLGASLAPSLIGPPEDGDVASRIARRALTFAPGMSAAPISGAWFAHRPMSPDGLPIAGMLDEGLYVHGGHGSLGMQSAPASARWLARHILEPGSTDSLDWLDCSRVIAPGEDSRFRWISPR